ncbi:MAG: chemotaxis protein MotC [Rhizobiaceae bacterium]
MMAWRAASLTCAAVFAACAAVAAEPEPLQAYQMVRSLQLVQDRIAGGDHAALPMQRKLLEMIDAKFRSAEAASFQDRRNVRSLLIYAMSGGNPVTVDVVRSRFPLEEQDRRMLDGVLDYLNGRPKRAGDTLSRLDPMALEQDLGAFLALVKGSVAALEAPETAIALFDKARLLGPGTLVEEAALRRSVSLAIERHDPERFLRWSSQYARRFLRSPYAAQFADSFVSGVMALSDTIDLEAVEEIISWMNPEQRMVVYLRLARRAAIEGQPKVSAFAAPRAEGVVDAEAGADPRAGLYAALATVTSENVADVARKIGAIDATRLSVRDRELLDAVRRVATQVIAPLGPVAPEPAVEKIEPSEPAPPPSNDAAANAGDEFIPETAESVAAEPRNITVAEDAEDAPGQAAPDAEPDSAGADEATKSAAQTASDARKTLAAIDTLLNETSE